MSQLTAILSPLAAAVIAYKALYRDYIRLDLPSDNDIAAFNKEYKRIWKGIPEARNASLAVEDECEKEYQAELNMAMIETGSTRTETTNRKLPQMNHEGKWNAEDDAPFQYDGPADAGVGQAADEEETAVDAASELLKSILNEADEEVITKQRLLEIEYAYPVDPASFDAKQWARYNKCKATGLKNARLAFSVSPKMRTAIQLSGPKLAVQLENGTAGLHSTCVAFVAANM